MNFDTPTSTAEKEPRFPSLEEIKMQIAGFITDPEIVGSEKISDDTENPTSYEVATMDEAGRVALYSYTTDVRTGIATLYVSYWKGHPDNGQWLPGGTDLASYEKAASRWTIPGNAVSNFDPDTDVTSKQIELPKPPENASEAEKKVYFERIFHQANIRATRTLIDMAGREKTPREDTLEMIYSSLMTIDRPQSQDEFLELTAQFNALSRPDGIIISSGSIRSNRENRLEGRSKEEGLKELTRLFEAAEKILGTTDVQELEAKERDSLEFALTRRALAKPFADRTLNEILRLNQSDSIKVRNPNGHLEEHEFIALNRRRNILMNAVGSWNALIGGIRHDLNQI